MGAAIHSLHRRRILFGWMPCLVLALIVKFRQDWKGLSSYNDAARHLRKYQLKIPYERFFYAEDSSSNSNSTASLSSPAEVAVVLPEALEPTTFQGCCAINYERMPQFDRDPWKSTCHTERACSNETLYPFSSAEEAAFLAKWKPVDVEVKQFHRQSCKAAADQLHLEATWCHPATAVAPSNHQDNNATPTATTTNIPEAVYPMGCSRYSMGGGSGPYDRLIVFPSAKLAFCGIPKAGITRWLQFLRFTLGAKDYQDPPYAKLDHMPFYFDQLQPKVQQEIWNDPSWTRAVLIREPTERLLSAYLDKVAPQSKIHGNLTFAEFVGLLRQTPTTRENKTTTSTSNSLIGGLGWYSDPHWRPQSYSCGLAQLLPQFQHVGGLDRVAEHAKAILQSVGLWETHGQHYRLTQNKTKKIRTEPPEPLELGQVALGFQQESLVSDNHSRGAQAKIDEYYIPELLKQVKELYRDDYALWEALQVAGPQGKVHGKDIAAILNPNCADDRIGVDDMAVPTS